MTKYYKNHKLVVARLKGGYLRYSIKNLDTNKFIVSENLVPNPENYNVHQVIEFMKAKVDSIVGSNIPEISRYEPRFRPVIS